MNILFVTSECAPFSKSGGLADVAFSLPPQLKKLGHEIAVITPLYPCVQERFGEQLNKKTELSVWLNGAAYPCGLYWTELNGVIVWFVENEAFFHRPRLYGYDDDKKRFAWFCRAVIEVLFQLDFVPQILHCNDWETALAILYLKNDQAWRKDLNGIKTVYTIHNIAYQGQFGANELADTFGLPWGWYDGGLGYVYEGRQDVNLMKGAMLMADAVSTVSPTYARELHRAEFGCGLQGVVDLVDNKLYGILNGIDMEHYDPASDPRLPRHFSADDLSGKETCKASIQEKFGLTPEPRRPLLAVVARLVEQKGIDLIREILPDLMDMGVQLIIFGQGDETYTQYFRQCAARYPGQLGFSSDYTEQMASEIFAGADFYLMPSRFEPCGLSQMMAMRCGTVPIVHETGGLKDSVRPYSRFDGIGDGFSFSDYQSKDLLLAIQEALKVYFADEKTFTLLRKRCMQKDFSWLRSAEEYTRMYARIADDAAGDAVPFEDAYAQLRDAFIALDRENRVRYQDRMDPNYHRVIQFHITGRTDGVLHVSFSNGELEVAPAACDSADAYITAAFDQLLNMANGTISFDRLFLTGQLKVEGNLSKGAEIRQLLGKTGI